MNRNVMMIDVKGTEMTVETSRKNLPIGVTLENPLIDLKMQEQEQSELAVILLAFEILGKPLIQVVLNIAKMISRYHLAEMTGISVMTVTASSVAHPKPFLKANLTGALLASHLTGRLDVEI